MTRLGYYSASSLPTLVWNGDLQWSGAGTSDADGVAYRSTILGLLSNPSGFKLTVNSVDLSPPTGSIDIDIEVMEDGFDVSNMYLRMAITEDGVPYGGDFYDDVTRDMIDDVAVTVSNLGEVQNVVRFFALDPLWLEPNLELVAILQDDTDKKIHAAASSAPNPDYAMRYYSLGELQAVGPSSGFFYFDNFSIYNVGNLTDTFTVTATGDLPDYWSTGICDETICYGPTFNAQLEPGQSKELHMLVIPGSSGYASFNVEMTQAGVTYEVPRVLHYNYITDDVEVLVVDDDGPEPYENYIGSALAASGYTYGVWDRLTVGPSASTLSNFPAVVWSTGLQYPTLDAGDRSALGDYLDAGGALFITGQDIGWELHDQGGAAYQWYQDYLHANYIADDTNNYTLFGVPGDPVSDGIDLVITGGDGASNQEYPDDIDPGDGSATVIWTYDANRNGAIRADTGLYKVVYLSFGYEAIDNALDRRDVMQRSIDWLLAPNVPAGWVPDDAPLIMGKVENNRRIQLTWGASCLATDVNYEIYQGTLGDFYSHTPLTCATDGLEWTIDIPLGNKYYLVVPKSTTSEGSYGLTSEGVERPQGTGVCLFQEIGDCS